MTLSLPTGQECERGQDLSHCGRFSLGQAMLICPGSPTPYLSPDISDLVYNVIVGVLGPEELTA